MNVSVIIPSLNPNEMLMEVINGLLRVGFTDIIVINDGSDADHMEPFRQASEHPEITILTHDTNRGKGCALKTGFSFCIENRKGSDGVVTVDGDGQHRAKDVLACAEKMVSLKDKVVLGVRDFSSEQVPWHNRWGNKITCAIFHFACGLKISDTQTGLRAIPYQYLPFMCQIRGERFEYETEMLLDLKKENISVAEVTIETVYQDGEQPSHFRIFKDSALIYRRIFSFIGSSLFCTGIDFVLYSILMIVFDSTALPLAIQLLLCYALARIVSATTNYCINRKVIFHSNAPIRKTILKYYALSIGQIACSYGLIYLLSIITSSNLAGEILWKIPVDLVLFFVSYQVQQRWVFAKPKKEKLDQT